MITLLLSWALAQNAASADPPPPPPPAEGEVPDGLPPLDQKPPEPAAKTPLPIVFKPEIHIRPRFEADTGEDASDGGGRAFVVQRSRLGMSAELGPVTARAVLQDSRIWGVEGDPGKVTVSDIDIRIASVAFQISQGTQLTVGRQEFRWHEQRLIAIANWQPVGRVFNGGMLDVNHGAFHLQALGAITGEADTNAYEEESGMGGLLVGYQNGPLLVDAIYLIEGNGDPGLQRHTTGVFATVHQGVFSARVEAYLQFGKYAGFDLGAGMVGAFAAISPEVPTRPRFTLWYDWLSGDRDPSDGTINAFNLVYGAKHKFMGIADIIYYQMGGFSDGKGLHNPAFKFRFTPVPQLDIHVDAHMFFADVPHGAPRGLGHEVDVLAVVPIIRQVRVGAGAGYFQGQLDRPLDLFGWLQLDVRMW